ncbi:hypothetical protein Daus18300_006688 [Diaporthe australafricana]|uniref:Uncharacterized protein n=1 Tax=Diaporthe australafricana TaxID=127596 RepID=A0ABR3WTF5_9PEZI
MDPDPDSEFSLAMKVNGTYASLNAVYFEDLGVKLEAKDAELWPGTPAYRNSTSSDDPSDYFPDSLILNLTDATDVSAPPGLYGLVVTDPGDAHGVWSAVAAIEGEQQFAFVVTNGRSLWLVCPPRRNGIKVGL